MTGVLRLGAPLCGMLNSKEQKMEKGSHHANQEGLPGGGERDPSDPVHKPFLECPPLPSFTFPKDASM